MFVVEGLELKLAFNWRLLTLFPEQAVDRRNSKHVLSNIKLLSKSDLTDGFLCQTWWNVPSVLKCESMQVFTTGIVPYIFVQLAALNDHGEH